MIKRGDRPKSPSDISNCVGAEKRGRNVRGGTNGPMGPRRRWEKKSLPPLNWMCATTLRSAVVRLAGSAVAGRLVAGCPISLGRRTNERTGGEGRAFTRCSLPLIPQCYCHYYYCYWGEYHGAVHTLSSLPIPCAGGGEAWRGITPLMASHVRTQVREKRKRAERVKCFSNFGQCFRDVNLRNRYL